MNTSGGQPSASSQTKTTTRHSVTELTSAERWASKQYAKILDERATRLGMFRGLYQGRRIFCLGSGPSLLSQDPKLLARQVVISTNAAHRWLRTAGLLPTVNVCSDRLRLVELQDELPDPLFIFPTGIKHKSGARDWIAAVKRHPSWIPLRGEGPRGWRTQGPPTFDPSVAVQHCGRSVIFMAVQLAVFMGAASVALVGVDMDYLGPETHFTPGLEPRNTATIYDSCRPAFVTFREELERRGIEFLNATAGGRVDVLPRADFATLCRQQGDQ